MNLHVETHSGYKADEYPVRFFIDNDKFEVLEVEDRWYEPDSTYFKVFADDCRRYILKKTKEDGWEIRRI
ncbi:MAG: hypothetical protein GF401_05180 [Chitinivibrionales bacterium]|nr:hypothetical protein [Chitinivibrionales bacterium]